MINTKQNGKERTSLVIAIDGYSCHAFSISSEYSFNAARGLNGGKASERGW